MNKKHKRKCKRNAKMAEKLWIQSKAINRKTQPCQISSFVRIVGLNKRINY